MYIWQQKNWPRFRWKTEVLQPQLDYVRLQQGRLLGQSDQLTEELDAQAQMDALIQNAIRTSEIEGEKLNVSSVRSSVARHLGIPQAGLRDSTPQTDALVGMLLNATRHLNTALTLDQLSSWQEALFPEGAGLVDPVNVGVLRGDTAMQVVSGRVDRPVVHFEAPPRAQLDNEIKQFLQWFNHPPADLDGLLRAGIAHLWLITLHPFDDGNGRVARAVTDRALAQAEKQSIRFYSLSAAIMARRKEYYHQLEQTQKGEMDITPWLSWFLNALESALKQGQLRFSLVMQKTRFWQRHSQTALTERQIKVLNRLLDDGAGQEGAEGFKFGINAEKYKSLAKVSKATATRDLTDLLSKGCLMKLPGGGRSTRYTIAKIK